jgi:drug/metabolite transporter (DMT)-like permease
MAVPLTRRTRGTVLGVGAGLSWGLAFVVPELVHTASPIALTAVRYIIYGGISLLILTTQRTARWRDARGHLPAIVAFALTGNLVYFILVVMAVHLAGAPIVATTIGMLPVLIAVAGNLIDRAFRFRDLALPLVLVIAGLALVILPQLSGQTERETTDVVVGVALAVAATASWAWYGIANAHYLRKRPQLNPAAWASYVGIATGVGGVLLLPIAAVQDSAQFEVGRWSSLLIAGLVLGVIVSWLGTWLWNIASVSVPTALMGMLVAVETVSAYTYAYILRASVPPPLEACGLVLVIGGIVFLTRVAAEPEHPGGIVDNIESDDGTRKDS